jgi:hypothetical protein
VLIKKNNLFKTLRGTKNVKECSYQCCFWGDVKKSVGIATHISLSSERDSLAELREGIGTLNGRKKKLLIFIQTHLASS